MALDETSARGLMAAARLRNAWTDCSGYPLLAMKSFMKSRSAVTPSTVMAL